jgi:1-acyl-sn-glycerol-3-phosphate acyltransferase
MTPGVDHIGKNHGWSKEYIIFAYDAGVYRYIVLNLYIPAKNNIGGDHHVLPQVTIVANHTAWHDMAEMPYFSAFPNSASLVNDGRFVGKISSFHD